MEKNSNNYFTVSELSKLTGVSRQLLIYYDNNDIFKPDVIADNGYRYYSFYQYAILEIIVSLRKMDVPLQDIKKYLTERNADCLKNIYTQRLNKCEADLKKLHIFRQQLLHNLEPLNRLNNLRLDQIMLTEMPEINPSLTQNITIENPPKERMKKIAKFLLPALKSDNINDYYIGYILDRKEFFSPNSFSHYKVFLYNILPGSTGSFNLYLTIYTKFDHNDVPIKTKKLITDFIEKNNLKILSDVFILPINNHLITKGKHQRINKLCIQVEYNSV